MYACIYKRTYCMHPYIFVLENYQRYICMHANMNTHKHTHNTHIHTQAIITYNIKILFITATNQYYVCTYLPEY